MKNNLKNKTVSAKNYVVQNRAKIAVVATSIVWAKLLIQATEQHNEFLKEHDLYETFYAMDEDQ
jgi:hypothetical protein